MAPSTSDSDWRMLDAAVNRASEGLRVAGEVVRFHLDDAAATAFLRGVRQTLWQEVERLPVARERMLAARDSAADAGRTLPSTPRPRDPQTLFCTNLHRAQESLRCIEELFRALEPGAAVVVTELRYKLYEFEKDIAPRLAPLGNARKLDFDLYVVTGSAQSRGRGFIEVVAAALEGGAGCIQFRAKELSAREKLPIARDLLALCRAKGATFIVNDHLDVALAAGADGVHLGQGDFPIAEARRIVGGGMIIGASSHSVEQAKKAEAEGADLINVGPIFPTRTKETPVKPVGVELITKVRNVIATPQTCMGGINAGNVAQVVAAGAERAAVVSAVVGAEDVAGAARELVECIRQAKVECK